MSAPMHDFAPGDEGFVYDDNADRHDRGIARRLIAATLVLMILAMAVCWLRFDRPEPAPDLRPTLAPTSWVPAPRAVERDLRELFDIAIAGDRLAHRTGNSFSLSLDRVAAFCGCDLSEAVVIRGKIMRAIDAAEEGIEAALASASPVAEPVASRLPVFDELTPRQRIIAEALFLATAGGADDSLMDLAASIACAQAVAVDKALTAAAEPVAMEAVTDEQN